MKLPGFEIKRQNTKRQRERERKKRRAQEERAKGSERKIKKKNEVQQVEKEKKSKKKEEERNKARLLLSTHLREGRLVSAGSTSEDEEKEEIHRLEAPGRVPRLQEWTRVDLIVDSGASNFTLPVGVLRKHPIGEVGGYGEFSWHMDVSYQT